MKNIALKPIGLPQRGQSRYLGKMMPMKEDMMKATQFSSRVALLCSLWMLICFSTAYAAPANPASGPVDESLGEHIDDSVITGKVKTALLKERKLKSLDIHVKTVRGIVYLSGTIGSTEDRKIAIVAAKSVDGVKAVKDEMVLR